MSKQISPEEQWRRTACLAERWWARHAKLIEAVPDVWGFSETGWQQYENDLLRHFGNPLSIQDHWRAQLFERFHACLPLMGEAWELGQVVCNTRHFMAGDLVLLTFTNGCDRHPIWTCSSRGRSIAGAYVSTDRLGFFGVVRYLGWPDELVGLRPTDPTAQKYAVSLRTDSVAFRIGAGSPDPSPAGD